MIFFIGVGGVPLAETSCKYLNQALKSLTKFSMVSRVATDSVGENIYACAARTKLDQFLYGVVLLLTLSLIQSLIEC